jgi:hypothetical protein
VATRGICASVGQKVMSFMPSGSKMRVRKNRSSGMPDAISMMRPSVSKPAPGL